LKTIFQVISEGGFERITKQFKRTQPENVVAPVIGTSLAKTNPLTTQPSRNLKCRNLMWTVQL
jgi:hypothetical protein